MTSPASNAIEYTGRLGDTRKIETKSGQMVWRTEGARDEIEERKKDIQYAERVSVDKRACWRSKLGENMGLQSPGFVCQLKRARKTWHSTYREHGSAVGACL